MTTFNDPGADELVSAVLDGVATPAEVDQVMGDPALQARLAEFRVVRDAVARAAPPLTPSIVDEMLDEALDAFGTADVASEPGPNWAATLPTWSDHRGPGGALRGSATSGGGARRSRRSRLQPLAIAAALEMLAGVGLFLVLSARSNTHSPRTAHADSTRSAADGARNGSKDSARDAAQHQPSAGTPSTLPPGPPAPGAFSLGSFPDQTTMAQALSHLDPQTLKSASGTNQAPGGYAPTAAELSRCDVVMRGNLDRALTDRLGVAGATLGGRQVLVASYRAPATAAKPDGVEIVVADAINCYPVLTQTH